MSEETPRTDMTRKTVVLELPGMDAVTIQRDVPYRTTEDGAQTMDLYRPSGSSSAAPLPVVVFVSGYPDPGFERMLGCKLKDMGQYVSWARLVAASGLVAVTYANREPADVHALFAYLRQNAASLGIDASRIGVWAGSGNVPMALSLLMQGSGDSFRCAALCYGFMLDLGGATHVAGAAAQFGFANPCAGKSIDDLPRDLPLFLVRAGQDQMPHLNDSLDAFLAAALAHNLPVTLANHATGLHAFDLLEDSETSREMIRSILAFLRFHLTVRDTRDSAH
jgi:acetyl esterase/lipase